MPIARTKRKIPLLDLKAQHAAIRDEVLAAVTSVIDAQAFILGPEVEKLEETAREYCRAKHAIGCASGSDALLLALLAAGVGPGDEVLTSPYTFFATAGAIHHAGAKPVFADIDAATFNLDPASAAAVLARNPKVKAMIPVHLFGAPAEMDALLDLCRSYGLTCVEDAAQSIGAEYKGRRCGAMGEVACFSFFPSKNLGAYGDGGLLSTGSDAFAEKLRSLRIHGSRTKYFHDVVGINSRLDALQAAVLNVKFRYLDFWTAGRQRNADLYRKYLTGMNVPVALPRSAPSTTRHIYNQFVITSDRRNDLQVHLNQNGIGCEIYYPVPLHLQKCFAFLGYRKGDFPISETTAERSLALPIFPELTEDDLIYICETIRDFYRE